MLVSWLFNTIMFCLISSKTSDIPLFPALPPLANDSADDKNVGDVNDDNQDDVNDNDSGDFPN